MLHTVSRRNCVTARWSHFSWAASFNVWASTQRNAVSLRSVLAIRWTDDLPMFNSGAVSRRLAQVLRAPSCDWIISPTWSMISAMQADVGLLLPALCSVAESVLSAHMKISFTVLMLCSFAGYTTAVAFYQVSARNVWIQSLYSTETIPMSMSVNNILPLELQLKTYFQQTWYIYVIMLA